MTNTTIDWAPIQAVRGYAMLIEGKRIGLYNQVEMTIQGQIQRWGVAYLIITVDEWQLISNKMFERFSKQLRPPHPIAFASGISPETATISKAFIRDRKLIFPDEEPFWIGTQTKWNQASPPFVDLQTMIIDLYRWVDECLESSSSKISLV